MMSHVRMVPETPPEWGYRVKYVVIILDGASDLPLEELGGRTCLQVAATPNLDAMAAEGMIGLARTVPEGVEPSSSAACMSILGYDPLAEYIGRGAIEAASMGIELRPDQVALRLNLVALADDRMASYSGGHIPTAQSREVISELAAALDDDTFRLYPGVAYRHILVVTGHPELVDLDYTPPHDIPDELVALHVPRGDGAALLLDYMERARAVLSAVSVNADRRSRGELPVTDVWPFWPGIRPLAVTSFAERHGVSAAMTSGVDLLGGLAALTSIRRLQIDGVTDGPDNDYDAQAKGAIEALGEGDLVVIHVESPDEAGHAGDLAGKIAAIEAIDERVVARVRELAATQDIRVLAMPDHATPITLRAHVGDPVPFVIWGRGVDASGIAGYDEVAAKQSGLLVDPGRRIMDLLIGKPAD